MKKRSQEYLLGQSRVIVRIGDILDSEADVIVSSDDHRFTMGGGVSATILKAGGDRIREDAQRIAQERKTAFQLGDVVLTPAGSLPFQSIFHVVSRFDGAAAALDSASTRACISNAVTNSLKLLDGMSASSIAFPAIGTGYAKRPPADVAAEFARTLGPLLLQSAKKFTVEIVIHETAFPEDIGFMEFFRNFDQQASWQDRVVRDHTVAMIHGIRTDGRWHDRVGRLLRESDHAVNPVPLGYGFFDVFSFLLPIGPIRQRLIGEVADELTRLAAIDGTKRLSVIAHSFGTFLTAYALLRNPSVKITCLILCGSIVPRDFDWAVLDAQLGVIDRHEYPGIRVINDCGWRDIWPVFAHTITWGFGSSGRFGFQTGAVKDRFHNLAHSDFFTEEYVTSYWVTAITEGRIVDREDLRPQSAWWLQALTRFHVKYVIVAVCAYLTWRFVI